MNTESTEPKTVEELKTLYYQKQPDGHWFDQRWMFLLGDRTETFVEKVCKQTIVIEGVPTEYYVLERKNPERTWGRDAKFQAPKYEYFRCDTLQDDSSAARKALEQSQQ